MKIIRIAVAAAAVTTLANASPLPDYPLVFARRAAEEEAKPDICEVSYRIKVRHESPTNALDIIQTRSAETLAVLEKHGVKKEDIVGFEVDKDRVENYEKRDELAFLGYEMTRRIEFTLRDLKKYDPVVSTLLKTPDVTSIRTSFDRTDREEIESRLLSKAVDNARRKAELMAKGSNQKIVKLRAISQDGFYNFGERFGLGNVENSGGVMYSRSAPPKRELLFVPSTIEFRNSVSLIYEIEQKN